MSILPTHSTAVGTFTIWLMLFGTSHQHFKDLMGVVLSKKCVQKGYSPQKRINNIIVPHFNSQFLKNSISYRRSNNIIVPRFNPQFPKNSISYRGAILWNAVSSHFTDQFTGFYCKVKKDSYFKELDFSVQSVQSLPRHYQDFKCF